MQVNSRESLKGALSATAAFFLWGLIPIYWKLLDTVDAFELVLHRIFWSLLFLLTLVKLRHRWGLFLSAFKDKRTVFMHSLGGLLLAFTWFAFIYAVTHEKVLQASLAYFIVPLVNSALGFVFLKERLSAFRTIAVAVAAMGVVNEVILLGEPPLLAIFMALSFGTYGLLKKKTSLGAVSGLALENTAIFPISIVGLSLLIFQGKGAIFYGSLSLQITIVSIGVITSIPLLLFSYGAARVDLNTLGILQFIAPMVTFLLAVWLFDEPFPAVKLVTFLFIWGAIALYLWDSYQRKSRHIIATSPPE